MACAMPERDHHPSVLLVDPLYTVKGGGAAVTFWAMEALKKEFRLSVLAWGDFDLDEGNRLFGTAVGRDEFALLQPPALIKWTGETLNRIDPDPWSVQRWALLMRWAGREARGYDAVLCTNSEICLPAPCLQYIHFPYIGESAHKRESTGRRPWEIISDFDASRVKKNRSLVNSDWTGAVHRSYYGGATHTLYPPVPGDFPRQPWEQRENGFVCVGRFNGDKRLDRIIDMVQSVRASHPEFHLHLVGLPMSEESGGVEYYKHLRRRVAEHPDWLFLEEGLSRDDMLKLLSHHRYGIHAKQDEHFGIAVAELVKAGCITFAHRSGGQVEIIGDQRLLYDDQDEMVRRVLSVIESPGEHEALRERLKSQARLFSAVRVSSELIVHVREFISS